MSDGGAAHAASLKSDDNNNNKNNNNAAVQLSDVPVPGSSDVSEQEEIKQGKKPSAAVGLPRGTRFWSIIASLCVTGLLSALENTVVTTSLPTIVRDLDVGDNYIWITNVFFLTRFVTKLFFFKAYLLSPRFCTTQKMRISNMTDFPPVRLSSRSSDSWPTSSGGVGSPWQSWHYSP